ncbi:hypothetical protein BOX15_Mlig001895g2 [Macrostomum lignano]|uniref:Uncharacterized protein n=2 Tax=Macrostomum lignano TaxID=282301 RepID=A0A1I8I757_9PLAT|nr:hypothetical protein BOX15_Mlig001895g2 [Macrostomum lignano]
MATNPNNHNLMPEQSDTDEKESNIPKQELSSEKRHHRHSGGSSHQEHHHQCHGGHDSSAHGSGLLWNLRKGYQLMKELLSPAQGPDSGINKRRSQLPCRLAKFANPTEGWQVVLDWLAKISPKLLEKRIVDEQSPHGNRLALSLPSPQFDKHGNFQGFDTAKPLVITDEFGSKLDEQLPTRIIRLLGSGDLLRLLAEHLTPPGTCNGADRQESTSTQQPPQKPRQDILQLPLSYETALSHHHHRNHHLHLHLPHHHHHSNSSHHHHHQHQHHLPPDVQTALNGCELNLTIFHRFLASLILSTAENSLDSAIEKKQHSEVNPEHFDDGDVGAEAGCELRVVLGQQFAECNAVALLLRHHSSSLQSNSALSVMLLHLLSLMLVLGELDESPRTQDRQLINEILKLWENWLKWPLSPSGPSAELVEQVRMNYATLINNK